MGSTAANGNKSQHSIPTDILDDLCSRFIINLPPEDRGNLVRICFQMELAHWFYLDYYCTDETKKLYPCGIRDFAAHIFQHVPQLREHVSSLDTVLDNWREYKQTVPTYGAILLDTDLTHVLLVQSFWTKASWGFPKGKVNEDEEPWRCAAREVLEETGFDISKLINKNDFIEAIIHEQIVRLYIIGFIPKNTKFQPRTRNEIKTCEWFPLADLPSNKKDMTPKVKMGVSPNSFFMVLPFVKRMRRWVAEKNSKVFTNTRRTRHKSMGDIESTPTTKAKVKAISQGLQNEIQEYQQLNCNSVAKPNKNSNSHGNGNGYASGNGNGQGNVHTNIQGNDQGTSHGYNQGNSHSNSHSGSAKNTPKPNGSRKDKKAKRQLLTPQNTYPNPDNSLSLLQNDHPNPDNSLSMLQNAHPNPNNSFSTPQNTHPNPHDNLSILQNAHPNPNNSFSTPQNTHPNPNDSLSILQNVHPNPNNSFSTPQNIYPNPEDSLSILQNAHPNPNNIFSTLQIAHPNPDNSLSILQNTHPNPNDSFSPVRVEASPKKENPDMNEFFNFVAPSWANFQFDRQAILDCLT